MQIEIILQTSTFYKFKRRTSLKLGTQIIHPKPKIIDGLTPNNSIHVSISNKKDINELNRIVRKNGGVIHKSFKIKGRKYYEVEFPELHHKNRIKNTRSLVKGSRLHKN